MTQKCIVVNETTDRICYDGGKTFIGTEEAAFVLVKELSSRFPTERYAIYRITPLAVPLKPNRQPRRARAPSSK